MHVSNLLVSYLSFFLGNKVPEYRVFLDYYSELVTAFSSENLYHHFVRKSIITIADSHRIRSETDPRNKAEILLQPIGGALEYGYLPSFKEMLTIMKDHGSKSVKALANKISQSSELKGSDIGNKIKLSIT